MRQQVAALTAQLQAATQGLAETKAVVDGMRGEVALANGKRMAAMAAAAAAAATCGAAELKEAKATQRSEESQVALADLKLVEAAVR